MKLFRPSILRQTLTLFLLLMVVLGPVGFLLFRRNWVKSENRTEQRLFWGVASDLSKQLVPLLNPTVDVVGLQQQVYEFTKFNPRFDVYLLSGTGRIIQDFSAWEGGVNRQEIELGAIKQFLSPNAKDLLPLFGDDPRRRPDETSIFSAAPISIEGKQGYLYIILSNFYDSRIRQTSELVTASSAGVYSLGLLFASCVVVGVVCLYNLIRPLRQIASVIAEYDRGDFSQRLELSSRNELGEIARAFNKMADSIARQIEDMKHKDLLRRELIADVSHDLRGPVAGVSGLIELLVQDAKSMDTAAREDFYRNIRDRVDALSLLLSELFELSKLEAQEAKVTFGRVSLPQMFEDIVITFQSRCREKQVAIRAEYDDCPLIWVDALMISRVLTNLVDNALRYTPPGGEIVLHCEPRGGRLHVSVSDTGTGIAAGDMPRIFERTYQSPVQSASSKGLSGLGLSIVRKIIETHGGEISVQSTPGQGTVFSFDLPLA